jgi:nitrogen regulatory protein PII
MKTVFIAYNQAYKERIIEILDRMSLRGFTMWDPVQGRGTNKGEPHYGNHAWPTLNAAILTVIPDEKVEELLKKLHALDMETEMQGLHAYVWNVEQMV